MIFTVIVTFNGEKWIEACLKSVLESTVKTQLVIVDNNSTDNTLKCVKAIANNAKIIKQTSNLGFGKANNIGISYAMQQGATSVFLLNQDAKIDSNCLKILLETSKAHTQYAILSPIQCNWQGDKLEYYFSRFVMETPQFYADHVLTQNINDVYKVPFVNAASWFLTKKAIQTIGGFDPIFHHYGEDNNYCHRVNYHGYHVGVVSNCYIFHDSQKRVEPKNYLFSEAYYANETKQWQIKYGNINENYTQKDFNLEKKHILKLILLQILTLNIKGIKGYVKKYKKFNLEVEKIKQSRAKNVIPTTNYLQV